MKKAQAMFALPLLLATVMFVGCNLALPGAPNDSAIVTDIQAKLFQDSTLKTRDLHVDSQKGVVTLTGTVSTDAEKSAVENIARQEKGVKQVNDQLAVSTPVAQAAAPTPAPEAPAPEPAKRPGRRPSHHVRHNASAAADDAASTTAQATPASPQNSSNYAAAPPQPAPVVQQPPAQAAQAPVQVAVPAGTVITVRTIDAIDSARNTAGQEFAATLESPVVAGDRVVIPANSDATLRLVQANTSGRMRGSSNIQLELVSVTANGTTYNVQSGYYDAKGVSRGKRTAETVGGAAALGAIIGAIAGGRKGTAIGAGAGAATGAGVEAGTRGAQVKIPSESKIEFTLKAPLTVTVNPRTAQ